MTESSILGITKIEPRWNHQWANSPDISITMDSDPFREWEWLYKKIPRTEDERKNVFLLSTNNWPFVRFVHIGDPDGNPTYNGALGGTYKLDTGETFESRSGWSSRVGVVNTVYRDWISDELADVSTFTPSFKYTAIHGLCISKDYLMNHPAWPKGCHLVRDTTYLQNEVYWHISAQPDKVVKPPQ